MRNKKNSKRRGIKRYTIRQITLTDRLRSAVIQRRSSKADKNEENTAWLESLPKLPSEPKGEGKRVVIISKRGK